jgi:hypothetical protein
METKYFAVLMWQIDDNLFRWRSVAFINDLTHIYVVSFGWPREVVSSLKLEWHKWPDRNAENEQMDGEKQEHTSIKRNMAVSYEIDNREICPANISIATLVYREVWSLNKNRTT